MEPSLAPTTTWVLCTLPVQPLHSPPSLGHAGEWGPPLPVPVVAPVSVPGRKRALEAQVRAQLSFLPVLLQVRVARGGTEPGRHFTSSEGHAPAGDDKRGRPWLPQPGDMQGTPAPSQVTRGYTGEERVPERGVGTPAQHPNPPSSSLEMSDGIDGISGFCGGQLGSRARPGP